MDPGKREVIKYGLSVLLSNTIGLVAILGVAYLLGVVQPTLVILIVLLLIRPSAGGAHCSTPLNCNFFGVLTLPVLGLLVTMMLALPLKYLYIFIAVAFMLSVYAIFKNAPYHTQLKPKVLERRRELKRRTLALAFFFTIVSIFCTVFGKELWGLSIAAGLFWQSLILLPSGIKTVNVFDTMLSRILH